MLGVGVVIRVRSLSTNEVHDLVFSLSGNGSVRDDNLNLMNRDPRRRRSAEALERRQSRKEGTRRDELVRETYVLPSSVGVHLLHDPVSKRSSEKVHEGSTCD